MIRMRRAVLATVVLTLAAGACGKSTTSSQGGKKPKISIASTNVGENTIIAQMYAEALKNKGYPVVTRLNLGAHEVLVPALERGEVDIYPAYLATDLEQYDKSAGLATPDVNDDITKLRQQLKPHGLTALDPSPAADQNGFAVTKATADKDHLTKMSDLAPFASRMVIGAGPECRTRPFCLPGLQKTYGLNFKDFKTLDSCGPLTKNALENGSIDIGLVCTTDGSIPVKGFVLLQDDKRLQLADNIVAIVRNQYATGEVATVLNDIDAKLTTADLIDLNRRADVNHEDPDALAVGWLRDHGFLKRSK